VPLGEREGSMRPTRTVGKTLDLVWNVRASYQLILKQARDLVDNPDEEPLSYPLAVILTQTACELCVEIVFDRLVERRGLGDVKEWLLGKHPNNNLSNEGVSKLYIALSGDNITKTGETFWRDFKMGAKLRNDIVHRGFGADKSKADKFHKAAEQLISHLERHL
jgi:hypothetical protein